MTTFDERRKRGQRLTADSFSLPRPPLQLLLSRIPLVTLPIMSGPTSIFHLITSDEISIPVDRELLRSQSAVFRDMLELSSTSGEGGESCQVSETAEEVIVFVAGLEESYSICAELAVLVRLADKYDAPLALAHAVTGCW